jgi:hypothetical protein
MLDDRFCPSCKVVLPAGRTICPKCGKRGEANAWESPWKWIIWGFVAFGIAVLLFVWISRNEETGDTMRVHWLIALSYSIGGKWTVAGVLGAIGCFLMGIGLVELFRKSE